MYCSLYFFMMTLFQGWEFDLSIFVLSISEKDRKDRFDFFLDRIDLSLPKNDRFDRKTDDQIPKLALYFLLLPCSLCSVLLNLRVQYWGLSFLFWSLNVVFVQYVSLIILCIFLLFLFMFSELLSFNNMYYHFSSLSTSCCSV